MPAAGSMVALVRYLKQTKNNLIGNPTAKLSLCQTGLTETIVGYLNASAEELDCVADTSTAEAIRTEAANIVASLAYGPSATLISLLAASAPQAVLSAASVLRSDATPSLQLALARALKALAIATADVCGHPLWGLSDDYDDSRTDARCALEIIFQNQALDVYIPWLTSPHTQVKAVVCELIANAVRLAKHRTTVTEWLPPDSRVKEGKGKRGWEVPTLVNTNSPSRQGGWVIRHLVSLLRGTETKLQGVSLLALAALVEENTNISLVLSRVPPDSKGPSVLTSALSFTKARNAEVRLAGAHCATNIIRAAPAGRSSSIIPETSNLLHVLTGIISNEAEPSSIRTKACFTLSELATDDDKRCQIAWAYGTLSSISDLLRSITPTERPQEWDDGEPQSVIRLREAALGALATLALHNKDVRNEITGSLGLIPIISLCLSHPHAGTRQKACFCVRSLSRAVAVLRTSILDSGLSNILCDIVERRDEDRRVVSAALTGLCNLLNDFSPLRKSIIDRGTMRRIATLTDSSDHTMRLNAIWAIKNALYKASMAEVDLIMSQVGWASIHAWVDDQDEEIKEQGFAVLRNLVASEAGIDATFEHFGTAALSSMLEAGIGSSNEEILCQAVYTMSNISNGGSSHSAFLVMTPHILSALHTCMTHPKNEIQIAAMKCIEQLARERPYQLRDAGIDQTLRLIVGRDRGSSGIGLLGGRGIVEADADLRRAALSALHSMENLPGVFDEMDEYDRRDS